jgi:hypothetical protein
MDSKRRLKKKTEDAPAISGELTSSSIPASDRPENNLGIVKVGVGSTLPKKKKKEESYQRFFTSLTEDLNEKGFSIDLTFLFHDSKIYVKHNHDQAVPLIELLSSKLYPELREMCGIIFDYIEERYRMSPLMQQWKYSNKPWQVILHSFLVRYFKKAYPVNKLEIRIDEDGKGKREVTIKGEGEEPAKLNEGLLKNWKHGTSKKVAKIITSRGFNMDAVDRGAIYFAPPDSNLSGIYGSDSTIIADIRYRKPIALHDIRTKIVPEMQRQGVKASEPTVNQFLRGLGYDIILNKKSEVAVLDPKIIAIRGTV